MLAHFIGAIYFIQAIFCTKKTTTYVFSILAYIVQTTPLLIHAADGGFSNLTHGEYTDVC
jgi:ABC-type uncharacterized transport system permease subunit